MRSKNVYLKELGITPITDLWKETKNPFKKLIRSIQMKRVYRRAGVWPSEIWDLDIAVLQYMYTRCMYYLEEAPKHIDMTYNHMVYKEKEYTQEELLKMLIARLRYAITDDNLYMPDSDYKETVDSIFDIWKVISPAMWW